MSVPGSGLPSHDGGAPLPPPEWAVPPGSSSRLLVLVGMMVVILFAAIGAFAWWAVHLDRPAASRPSARGLAPQAAPGTDPGNGDTIAGGRGGAVDGIGCRGSEQLVSHRHAHLYILKDGAAQPVSAFVGIPGAPAAANCFYWLHTHDRSGIIHIESPDSRVYTLGEFFDIWGQPLSRSQVARLSVPGRRLTVYVDGKLFSGDPRQVHLDSHTQVVLEIGNQVPPPVYDLKGF